MAFKERLIQLIEATSNLVADVRRCVARVEAVNALAELREALRTGQVPADEVRPLLRKMQAALHDSQEGDAGGALSPVWTAMAAEAQRLLAARRDPAQVTVTDDRYEVAGEIEGCIGQLFAPFMPTERALRELLHEVRNLLHALPLKPAKLRVVREEIQGLPLFQAAFSPLRLSMRQAETDLPVLQERLQQMLELASVAPMRRDGRRGHKGRPRPFQQNEEVKRLKILVREMYQDLVRQGVRRDLQRMICQRLANHPRPPNARWAKYPWPEALRRFPEAVRTWLSKAIHERE